MTSVARVAGSSVEPVPAGDVLLALRGIGFDLLLASGDVLHETVRRIRTRWPEAVRPYIVGLADDASGCDGWMEAGADACIGAPLTDERVRQAFDRPPMPRQTVIDVRALEQLRELQEPGDPDLVAELVAMFRVDGAARMSALRSASTALDRKGVVRTAHSVKGSASTLGAYRLARLCAVMESEAITAEPPLLTAWAVLATGLFEQAIDAVTVLARADG